MTQAAQARPGFSFLVCPDPELVRERVGGLLAKHASGFRRQVYWGDEELPGSFWQALSGQSLLGEKSAVVLRRAENLSADFWPRLSAPLRGFNPGAWLFVCLEGAFEKRAPKLPKGLAEQPYWKVAKDKGWIWNFEGLTRASLKPMLADWAGARGLGFAPGALEAFVLALPLDMSATARELEKLELSLDSRREIRREDLSLISFEAELDAFEFLRALSDASGKAKQVWSKILAERSGSEGELLFPFLGLLISDARQMWQLAHGEPGPAYLPPQVRQAKRDMARALGLARLARIWELALDADAGVKSGQKSPDQAMQSLVADLFALFKR